jgi:hypothetical protein
MVTPVNDRDVLLQATVPRYVDPPDITNTVTVYIYQRKADATIPPTLPSVDCTYTFSPPGLTGLDNGWTFYVPIADMLKPFLFVTTAVVASTGNTVTVATGDWHTPQVLARDGQTGSTGLDAVRSPVSISASAYSSWSDATANAVLAAAGYGSPINRDMVTLFGPTFSQTKFWDNTDGWLALDAYIDGNLLVTGTLSAAKITTGQMTADRVYGGTLAGTIIQFSTGHTVNGFAFEITNGGAVWADNVFGGIGLFSNDSYSSSPGVIGYSWNSASNQAGVHGAVSVFNTNSGATGLVGSNFYNGTNGRIATGNGYDFYADGSGVNYGPFTGSHDGLIPNDAAMPELGDIVVDVQCVARRGLSNTIFEVAASEEVCQRGAVGVLARISGPLADHAPAALIAEHTTGVRPDYTSVHTTVMVEEFDTLKDQYQLVAFNAVGEGQINVCGAGGDIAKGDFIVASAVRGKGMRQDDDVYRSSTVARAREACTFTGASEVKQIACIYLCG